MESAAVDIQLQAVRLVEATAIFFVERVLLLLAFVCNFDQLSMNNLNKYTLEKNSMAQFWVIGLLFSNAAHFFIFLRRLFLIPAYTPSFLFTDPHPCFQTKTQKVFCFWAERAVMIFSVLPYLDDSFAYFGPVGLIAQPLLAIIITVFYDLDFKTEVAVKTNNVGKMEAKIDTWSNDGDGNGRKAMMMMNGSNSESCSREEDSSCMMINPDKLQELMTKVCMFAREIRSYCRKLGADEEEEAAMELERYKLEVQEKEHLMMASMELVRCEWEQEKEHLMAKLQVGDESVTVYRENQRLQELEREEWKNREAALSNLTAQAHQAISDAIFLKKKLHNLDNDDYEDDEMQSPHPCNCSYYFHPNSCQACSQFPYQHHY